MATIRSLFDPSKKIDRRIEKVIQYRQGNEALLRQEITEYITTDRLEESYYRLIDQIDTGMSADQEQEIGVWISGFYGSGKSSFTKYLGLALDDRFTLEGRPFFEWLGDRFTRQTTRQRLSTLLQRHPMTVIMLDLSTEALAGASMAPVSTVLYYKVLQWAGYSREKKIALLELLVDRDGKRAELESTVEKLAGEPWSELHNDIIAATTYAAKAASALYPKRWPTPEEFGSFQVDLAEKEDDRVREMLGLIERRSGRKDVLFVIDEVGQYIAHDEDRILNLQGLAQNLKRLSNGHAWLIATAQQTLAEDDTRGAINSSKLYKLQARFPVRTDLEASDIREICYRRLLGKSSEGQKTLEQLYAASGGKLSHLTEITEARGYRSALEKKEFVDLYPFLPHHFDLLLRVLGRLAGSGQGAGLRSAIKVVQDALVDANADDKPFADRPVGALITAASLYAILRLDIEKSYPHIAEAVRRVERAFNRSPVHFEVGEAIAFLQILEDFPLTRANLVALLHDQVDGGSREEEISQAIDDLAKEPTVPLVEVNGRIRFTSERINELQLKRNQEHPTRADERLVMTSALQSLLRSEPSAELRKTKTVKAGVRFALEGGEPSVLGEKEEIQFMVELVPEARLSGLRAERISGSIKSEAQKIVYFIGLRDPSIDVLVEEIYRSDRMAASLRGQTVERDVEEYATAQHQLADRNRRQLEACIREGLMHGVFVFQGQQTTTRSRSEDLLEAMRRELASAAEQVFDKYGYAAVANDGGLAERFLKTSDLSKVASQNDPLALAKGGGSAPIETSHPALAAIRDYLETNGTVDGRRLSDHFFAAPYGWSKDITRYLVAALLAAGQIVVKTNNSEETVRSDAAIDALKNVMNFNKAGVALRNRPPRADWIQRASERLLQITGQEVLPLEENIAKAVHSHFPELARRLAPLEVRLASLGLPGHERAAELQRDLHTLLVSSGEVIDRLGAPESDLAADIAWAKRLLDTLDTGGEEVVRKAKSLAAEIPALPDVHPISELKAATETTRLTLEKLLSDEGFFEKLPDIRDIVSDLSAQVAACAKRAAEAQHTRIEEELSQVHRTLGWNALEEGEQKRLDRQLLELDLPASGDLPGIARTMAAQLSLNERARAIREGVARRGRETAASPVETVEPGGQRVATITVPRRLSSVSDLQRLVSAIEAAQPLVEQGGTIELRME